MECTFQVGDRVVCIDNNPRTYWAPTADIPEINAIYTVSEGPFIGRGGRLQVRLREIQNTWPNGEVHGYWVKRFRPLVTTKTDISLFQKILEEASKEAKEKV